MEGLKTVSIKVKQACSRVKDRKMHVLITTILSKWCSGVVSKPISYPDSQFVYL